MLTATKIDELKLAPSQRQFVIAATEQFDTTDPHTAWRQLTQRIPTDWPFDLHEQLWHAHWKGETQSPSMWSPDESNLRAANLSSWMSQRNAANVAEFHRWSVDDRAEFWRQAIERLNIQFDRAPDTVLDDSAGAASARWLPGARLNIALSCFQANEDAPAIISGAPGRPLRTMSSGELKALAYRVAGAIRQRGLNPGDPIAVVMPMTAESVAIYLGMLLAGCPVVSIADSFAGPEIATRVRIAGAKAVFTYDLIRRSGKTLPLWERVVDADAPPAIVLPVADGLSVNLRDGDIGWTDFLAQSHPTPAHIGDADESINILFSSGTTGEPKAIPWTHSTPLKCATDALLLQDVRPGDVVAWPTNLGWMMGPWLIFAALLHRATIALFDDAPIGRPFGEFISEARVTMLGVVPTLVKAWRSSRCMEGLDWSRIRSFSSTGESSQAADMLYLSWLAGYRPVIEYCGGTEIGGGYISSTVVQPNVPAMFSTPCFGLDVAIMDEQGKLTDDGELFLIPPSIGLSSRLLNRDHDETYHRGVPQHPSGQPLRRHGDHFRRTNDGYYAAGGRVDDTMNLGGIKISSAEIERVLNRLEGVRETAAITQPGQSGPSQLVICTVLESDESNEGPSQEGLTQLRAAMNEQLKSKLNPLFRVAEVLIVESLPRTASNKVMRRKLRDLLRE